jgi:two-component system chemotaxis response regulator CheB
MDLVRKSDELRVRVYESEKSHTFSPSVDVLFNSVANVMNSQAVGVLLTGMARDGANGLLKMRQNGARTIVQDEASSAVFGMPKAAIEANAAELISSLEDMPRHILMLLGKPDKLSA